jgi:hypothetical protein
VRTEGILTQLVFDHALRIRMKEEAEPRSAPTTVASTPETRSIAEGESEGEGEGGSGSADSAEETLQGSGRASTTSSAQAVAKGKGKAAGTPASIPVAGAPGPDGAKPEADAKAANLVGKINNFVTTDLGNITDGRDFLFVGESSRRLSLTSQPAAHDSRP